MKTEVISDTAMREFGYELGATLRGGEVIELVGDVGAGKTTLTKGIAEGLGIAEDVQSPTFTISRVYDARDGLRLSHYDFYRLHDAGIMADELRESLDDSSTITIIEWSEIVAGVLPRDRLTITIQPSSETARRLEIAGGGERSDRVVTEVSR